MVLDKFDCRQPFVHQSCIQQCWTMLNLFDWNHTSFEVFEDVVTYAKQSRHHSFQTECGFKLLNGVTSGRFPVLTTSDIFGCPHICSAPTECITFFLDNFQTHYCKCKIQSFSKQSSLVPFWCKAHLSRIFKINPLALDNNLAIKHFRFIHWTCERNHCLSGPLSSYNHSREYHLFRNC